MPSVKAECSSCGGTGLYCGMCEAEGTAVVCVNCNGTGCEEIQYKAFTSRKGKRGVKTVSCSRGTFIPTGVGKVGKSISYKEFKDGGMPKR